VSVTAAETDPFGLTADPERYVPREATEQALAALEQTLREGRRPAALVGPPGLGKTLLLHMVGMRLDDRLRPVYLPYAALPLDELCAWALSLLGFSHSDDTIGDLMQTASQQNARGSGLLLLIDDASAMPLPTARKLGDLVATSGGALRLLVAAVEGASASRMLAATGANVHVVKLLDPMSAAETQRYVAARLAHARVPSGVAARFDAEMLQSIHRLSAGIPRRVHGVASAVLRGRVPESLDLDLEFDLEADASVPEPPLELPPAPGDDLESREAAIRPAFEALRAFTAPRAESRVEAAPSTRSIFATALLVGGLALALPGLRAQLAPPAPDVAAATAPTPRPAPMPEPTPPAIPAPAPAPEATALPQPGTGTISVQVNARPWANIEVDGVDLGPTPLAGIPLLEGPHRFRARMPDGRVVERDVEIGPESRFIVFE
jgi:type II secretory pathway predicted ATPase ExeA